MGWCLDSDQHGGCDNEAVQWISFKNEIWATQRNPVLKKEQTKRKTKSEIWGPLALWGWEGVERVQL